MDNKKKILEEIFVSKYTDTKHKTNTSPKPLNETLIIELENGITSEKLFDLKKIVDIYTYKSQITIHGIFKDWNVNRFGGYQNVVLNKNNSIGVRYTAIDTEKKEQLKQLLRFINSEFRVQTDSKGSIVFKTIRTENKEKAFEIYKEMAEEKNNIMKCDFFGTVNVQVYNYLGMFYIDLIINLDAILQNDIAKFFNTLTKSKIYTNVLNEYNVYLENEKIKNSQKAIEFEKKRLEMKQQSNQLKEKIIADYKTNGFKLIENITNIGQYTQILNETTFKNVIVSKSFGKLIFKVSERCNTIEATKTATMPNKGVSGTNLKGLFIIN